MSEDAEGRWVLICGGSMLASTLTGLLTFILAVALYTVSPLMPVYPKFLPVKLTFPCINIGYSPFWQYISELGMGPTAAIFNTGMIASGILVLPAFATIRRTLGSSPATTIGALSGLVGGVSLTGVGVFPMTPAFFIQNPHGLVPPFIGLSLAAAFLGYSIARNTSTLKAFGWLGTVILIINVALGVTRDPLLEWIAALAITAWFTVLGSWLLLKTPRKP
ncbi:MAG: DUF998 domain-containing protein [Candidatus Freyarchaeota archaeon]